MNDLPLKNKTPKVSLGFIFSIISSLIGASLISLLILFVPRNLNWRYSGSENPSVIFDNFFYDVQYWWFDDPGAYFLDKTGANLGLFIILPIALIFTFLAGSTLLVRNFNETKKLIYINWLLFSIPALIGLIVGLGIYLKMDYTGRISETIMSLEVGVFGSLYGGNYTWSLGLLPLNLSFLLSISLLSDQNSFLDWSAFSKKGASKNLLKRYSKVRKVSASLYLVFALTLMALLLSQLQKEPWESFLIIFSLVLVNLFFLLWLFFELFGRIAITTQLLKNDPNISNPILQTEVVKHLPKRARRRLGLYFLTKGETSLQLIANNCSLEIYEVTNLLSDALCKGKLYGSISSDGFSFVPSEGPKKAIEGKTSEQQMGITDSQKSRTIALVLCIFLGQLGIHRFYVERTKSAILYLCTLGLFGIGSFVDFIMLLVGSFKDANGRPLINWELSQESDTNLQVKSSTPLTETIPPPAPNAALKRKTTLRKIILMYETIAIDELVQLLNFPTKLELQKWLLNVPEDLTFQIRGDKVFIPTILRENSNAGTQALERLLESLPAN